MKFKIFWGSAPDPAGGAHSAPRPPSWWGGGSLTPPQEPLPRSRPFGPQALALRASHPAYPHFIPWRRLCIPCRRHIGPHYDASLHGWLQTVQHLPMPYRLPLLTRNSFCLLSLKLSSTRCGVHLRVRKILRKSGKFSIILRKTV